MKGPEASWIPGLGLEAHPAGAQEEVTGNLSHPSCSSSDRDSLPNTAGTCWVYPDEWLSRAGPRESQSYKEPQKL